MNLQYQKGNKHCVNVYRKERENDSLHGKNMQISVYIASIAIRDRI